MEFYGALSVVPKLPTKIKGLEELAYNLWWCWNSKAEELFEMVDAELWEEVNRNPVKLLSRVDYERLEKLSQQPTFSQKYNQVIKEFKEYMQKERTWFSKNHEVLDDERRVIAYFCTEFGFHESLPIYSGGLGVLAGDHCKSASDLGLPFVGVGLLYRQGYFEQRINEEGWQEELYPDLNFSELPITPVKDENGEHLTVSVELVDREVLVKVWEVKIGRVSVYLLDTDMKDNKKEDRKLTSRLYGGDEETRICQEIILGVGGARALKEMNYIPSLWHMNEGHSVYLELERIKDLMQKEGLSFNEAIETVAANTVFTTHTPVPAGNETFSIDLKEKYFSDYWEELGISQEDFMNLGQVHRGEEEFGLTVLGLRSSRFKNGVSELHGKVSSKMWEDLWSDVPPEENPITHITNGIHTLTWLASEWIELFDKYLPADWRERLKYKAVWKQIKDIPQEEFWHVHQELKNKMIDYIRQKDIERRDRYNSKFLNKNLLSKDVLTIGFARRFATYKRADLIFKDLDRLSEICNNKGKEVQLIFAGKAHPADIPGKNLIKKIYEIMESDRFAGKVLLLENYDMNLAKYLVQGVDVWLNNPRRPMEASGTSGQKVAVNGGLNFSVLDGWWCEGYNGKNGWVIGREEGLEYRSDKEQDSIDSESLYETLEKKIVPLYYNTTKNGTPWEWVSWMKESMVYNGPRYSSDRMVYEYVNQLYMPAVNRGIEIRRDDYQKAGELVNWKEKVKNNWNEIKITSPDEGEQGNFHAGDSIKLTTQVELTELTPEDVQVELYLVTEKKSDKVKVIQMDLEEELENNVFIYSKEFELKENGTHKYTFRVVPDESRLTNKHELGLIEWIK